MAISEVITFIALSAFAVVILPILFIHVDNKCGDKYGK